jgi:hypothetical protein
MGRPSPVTAAGIVLLAGAPWVTAAVGALDAGSRESCWVPAGPRNWSTGWNT